LVDFEHGLNTTVKKLRVALGDSPTHVRYIETVPRIGYRFVALVETAGEQTPKPAVNPESIYSRSSGLSDTDYAIFMSCREEA